jgi:hypothetical protein
MFVRERAGREKVGLSIINIYMTSISHRALRCIVRNKLSKKESIEQTKSFGESIRLRLFQNFWREISTIKTSPTQQLSANSSTRIVESHGSHSRKTYSGIISPSLRAFSRSRWMDHRSIHLLAQSLQMPIGRHIATLYPLVIELFSVGRMHLRSRKTRPGKNSNIKIEIFPVLSENG